MNLIIKSFKKSFLKLWSLSLTKILAILGMAVGPILLCYGPAPGGITDNAPECKFDSEKSNVENEDVEQAEVSGKTQEYIEESDYNSALGYLEISTIPATGTVLTDESGCFSLYVPNDGKTYIINAKKYGYIEKTKSFKSENISQYFTIELKKNTDNYNFITLQIVADGNLLLADVQLTAIQTDETVSGKYISDYEGKLLFPFLKSETSQVEISLDGYKKITASYDPTAVDNKLTVDTQSAATVDETSASIIVINMKAETSN